MNGEVMGEEHLQQPGPYLLASNHFSHVDPLVLGAFLRRPVHWMTRIEFFKYRPLAWLIRRLGGFCVNRSGPAISAIRMAISRLEAGYIVGVFPEGGVTTGAESVCRGAAIKQGVCLISCRTQVPIIPCVILGSHKLAGVGPWLPFRRARVWIAFGPPLLPPAHISNRKTARREMTMQLQQRLMQLSEQLTDTFHLDSANLP
jgi:1-acyl-sn-glycerol-3-phosphate acyltransferase